MNELQTILGTDIPVETRAVLYLCILYEKHIEVKHEMLFNSVGEGFNAYANIPNPESQLAYGKTFDELIKSLHLLHENMKKSEWIEQLHECI